MASEEVEAFLVIGVYQEIGVSGASGAYQGIAVSVAFEKEMKATAQVATFALAHPVESNNAANAEAERLAKQH